ncbi:hypothetical protein OK074_7637 [Actinobacteria bacterium OK074]|nr:hypothetical protein OK074_7637 [Actinobacteria bacterium OK074]
MDQKTTADDVYRLALPQPEPTPVGDCHDCARLDRARTAVRITRDMSAVSDCNVLMRRHQAADHPDPSPPRP